MLTEVEKAYLAGVFDGEGCISIVRRQSHIGTPMHQLRVIIVQADETFLQRWRDKLDGMGRIHRNSEHEHVYQWYVTTKSAEKLLRLLYPYLELKREQAEVAFRFRETFGPQGGRGIRLGKEIIAIRDECHDELHRLKGSSGKRGAPAKTSST